MKNTLTITVRTFPVVAHDHRTGKEEAITVTVTRDQLRAAGVVGQSYIKNSGVGIGVLNGREKNVCKIGHRFCPILANAVHIPAAILRSRNAGR